MTQFENPFVEQHGAVERKPRKAKETKERIFDAEVIHKKTRAMLERAFQHFLESGQLRDPLLTEDAFDMRESWLRFLGIKDDDGRYSQEERVGTRIFFDEFVKFIQEKRRENVPSALIERYAGNWHERAFSVSPNMFNALPFSDAFTVAANLFMMPETRQNISANVAGELVYELQFSHGDYSWLRDLLTKLPLESQLGVIHLSEYICKYAEGEGYADDVLTRFRNEFKARLSEEDAMNPMYRYVLEEALSEFNIAYVENGGSLEPDDFVFEKGDFQEYVREKSRSWGSIRFDRGVDSQKIQISRDYIASLDRVTNMPEAFAKKPDEETLPAELGPDFAAISRAKELIGMYRQFPPSQRPQIFEFVQNNIISKIPDDRSVPQRLASFFPEISESAWAQILDRQENIRARRDELLKKQQAESASDANQKLFDDFCVKVTSQRKKLEQDAERDTRLRGWVNEYFKAETDTQRFNALNSLSIYRKDYTQLFTDTPEKPFPKTTEQVLNDFFQMQERQRENFDLEKTRYEEIDRRMDALNAQLDRREMELLSSPNFPERMKQVLSQIEESLPIKTVHAELFEQFEGNQEILPLGHKFPIDSAALLKELHRPEIRVRVEEDIGLSLNELTLREQVSLLSWMAIQSKDGYERVVTNMRRYNRPFAVAFLSCEEDAHAGASLNRIAESFTSEAASKVFQKYAELADIAEQASVDLEKAFYTDKTGNKLVDRRSIEAHLLARAKQLINVAAAKAGETRNDVERSSRELVQQLEGYRTDMIVFAAVFKEIAGSEKNINFAEWKRTSIDLVDPQTIASNEREKLFDECKSVLLENWSEKGVDAAQGAMHGLEEGFAKKEFPTRFHFLKQDNHIVAFLRFDERPDLGKNVKYAGSFNVIPALKNASLGASFFRETLAVEGKGCSIVAEALAADRATSLYVEDFGFEITGVERYKTKDGKEVAWFSIKRAAGINERINNKQKEFPKNSKVFNDLQEFISWVEKESKLGKVISRYKISAHGKMTFYEAVSERLPD
ncbi:MAG: hypothetical protein AAB386_00520 [Patescibacteria group bacterium]